MNLNLNDSDRKEIINEFNQNYRLYLENNLILSLISDTVFNTQAKLIHSSSSATFESEKNDPKQMLDEKIRDTFLKSYFITNNSDNNFKLPDEIKIDPLSFDAKNHLVETIEHKLDEFLDLVDEFTAYGCSNEINECRPKLDQELSGSKQENVTFKFNQMLKHIDDIELESKRLDDGINIKLEHCMNTSMEVINLINFKLDFYAHMSEIQCQGAVLSCDLLLTKIEMIKNEMLHDFYSPEKLKALGIIKNHIQMETMLAKDNLNQTKFTLNTFNSFGSEFDSILKTYLDLKSKHEIKKM
ncbi:HAUS augmin-like complex subunit 4 [Brachionus plicatilis]|uniref:HAUS augmin-like complex subunit 4 n=1 Tax=Brachionus plicatilis TaxID=10195 RepID=A0A3M7QE65_BRAPC|nr:HAUS augmin-like complex subunit 4 [Brachionus plicatilis]